MIRINENLSLAEDEISFSAIRAQGSGGQNVNKVATAIHLRFDIAASSLPETVKDRLLASSDQRINSDGIIVIKAQSHRSQDKNRSDAVSRLVEIIREATKSRRKRIATKPGRAAKQRRLDEKKMRGSLKKLRSGKYD